MEVLKINKNLDEFLQRLREPPDDEIAVLGRIASENTLEFFFPNAHSMSRIVGVGLEYSSVVLNTKLNVSVFGMGRIEWLEAQTRALDDSSDYVGMLFKFPVHKQPAQPQGELLTGQEASRKFGVGLAGAHVYDSYAGGGEKVVARCPLLWELAVVLLQQKFEEHDVQAHDGRAADTESSVASERKDLAVGEMEESTGVNQWSELLKIYYKNGKPDCGAPRGKFRKLDQRVTVHPLPDGSFTNMKQESIDPPVDLVDAQISSQLVFKFVYNSDEMGNERKIEVTNRTKCELGEHGFKVDETDRFGWYHDDIQISFRCKDQDSNPSRLRDYAFSQGGVEQRLAETSSVDDDDEEEHHVDTDVLHELEHSQGFAEGLLISKIMEEEGSSGNTVVMERTFKLLGRQNLGGFCVLNHSGALTVTYTLMFKTALPDSIWKPSVRKSLLNCGPCLAVWGKVTGSWELLNEEESAPYQLKVERKLQEKLKKVLAEDERTYQNDIFARNTIQQTYKVPLFVNHVMSHFLVR